ncbi:putative Zn-dependent hydrolase, including glyoxylase [Methanocella conradii HZ254]|uniref:Zn-dependent hydrolase, including glyoxylase n=1 Tax=Methanocella conradii (strain DSM 24694 / JCM 17849 / CGMCC 1.5162 / HZ254) TaxID=1041930 RepID=H8IAV3_METCZ|nr:MBL fold metallo-hydrolase [Methanocella conradii]AFD00608.1 putative Zn-dependent hydrolase, including glyoxylase [Methanocella conradii HZ254]MDI6896307.1 MBL fold metallo-hydrolase [Methanocella conradii]
MSELVPGVHLVDGSIGCNTYLIVGDGVTLIDTGLKGNEKRIYDCLGKLGYGPKDIRRIVITHAHIDHINCLGRLKADTGALVMASEQDSEVIEGRRPIRGVGGFFGAFIRLLRLYYRYTPVKVDVRLKDGDKIGVPGGFEAILLSGHSAGSIGLYSRERGILFSSDTIRVLNGKIAAPHPKFTENGEKAIEAIERMAGLDFNVLLPGHGKPVIGNASDKVKELCHELKR